jgi:hypothetical protein
LAPTPEGASLPGIQADADAAVAVSMPRIWTRLDLDIVNINAADGADGCALTAELTEGWSADLMGNLAIADATDAAERPEIGSKGWTFRVICFSLSTALIGIRAGKVKTDGLALGTDLRAIRLAGSHFVVRLESIDTGCFISVRCLIAGCFNAVISGFGAGCLGAGCFIALAVAAAVVPVVDVVVGCQWAIFFSVLFVTGVVAGGTVRRGSCGIRRGITAGGCVPGVLGSESGKSLPCKRSCEGDARSKDTDDYEMGYRREVYLEHVSCIAGAYSQVRQTVEWQSSGPDPNGCMNCVSCRDWCASMKNLNWIWRERELYLVLVHWHDDE